MTYTTCGRCKSGRRWFWYATVVDYDYPRCDDPVCEPGLHPHEYGWEDTEDLAVKAMVDAVARFGGGAPSGAYRGNAPGRESAARAALKRINTAKRRARPAKPGANDTTLVEYLYEPWSWADYEGDGETRKGINEIPIVKKTAKRIYYDSTDRWDRTSGVVTLGYLNRQDFDADTRCRRECPRGISVMTCAAHGRDSSHCVHFAADVNMKLKLGCYRPGGCGQDCPLDARGTKCAEHGYTWGHCPHGGRLGQCWRGLPPGAARLPGNHYGGGTVYATREAAEEHLYRWEREQERKRREREPELKRLRTAMVKAHPDVGGSHEAFLEARAAYERALRAAS